MKTLLLSSEDADIREAARIIKNGGVVAMPTETVYGLAADALNGAAVKKIFEAKGRPADNPLIVHISEISQIYSLVREFPEKARRLAKKFWPGPLTMILPKSALVPDEVSAGLDTVAVRFPSHNTARRLITLSAPLAAPSANLSGSPSPTSFNHVRDDMDGRIDAIIDGGDCDVGVESTVITLATPIPELLRPGGITFEQLKETIGEVIINSAVINPLAEGQQAASPGMKYKHYAPKAEVILIDGSGEQFYSYIRKNGRPGEAVLCYSEDLGRLPLPCISIGAAADYRTQAHRLFTALRTADEEGVSRVYAKKKKKTGIGLAVYNRIIRAAGFNIIKP